MDRCNVLIIVDREDVELISINRLSEHWNLFWQIVDYTKLYREITRIKKTVVNNKIDFIQYSRNDQVADRVCIGPLTNMMRTGYSSFSAIDENNRVKQMWSCFEDFLSCGRDLIFEIPKGAGRQVDGRRKGWTFSLAFDVEQLGGVRYGLPRILELLNRYGVEATFFLTNLMKRVYPNVLGIIRAQGHEIGLHGLFHEYLPNWGQQEQTIIVREMLDDFGGMIEGANFIGRMNDKTLQALAQAGLKYFVHPSISYYRLTGYSKHPTAPSAFSLPDGVIWMLPISVETYGSPWFSVKNMIDTNISKENRAFPHVSILCHPFRDGGLAHMAAFDKMLRYIIDKGLIPIKLKDAVNYHLSSGGTQYVSRNDRDARTLFCKERIRLDTPRARRDVLFMIPENAVMVYRMIKHNRSVF